MDELYWNLKNATLLLHITPALICRYFQKENILPFQFFNEYSSQGFVDLVHRHNIRYTHALVNVDLFPLQQRENIESLYQVTNFGTTACSIWICFSFIQINLWNDEFEQFPSLPEIAEFWTIYCIIRDVMGHKNMTKIILTAGENFITLCI